MNGNAGSFFSPDNLPLHSHEFGMTFFVPMLPPQQSPLEFTSAYLLPASFAPPRFPRPPPPPPPAGRPICGSGGNGGDKGSFNGIGRQPWVPKPSPYLTLMTRDPPPPLLPPLQQQKQNQLIRYERRSAAAIPNIGPGRECRFCKNNCETSKQYKSHILRNPATNQLICPVLRAHVCEECGATGDFAHTKNYCPKLKLQVRQTLPHA